MMVDIVLDCQFQLRHRFEILGVSHALSPIRDEISAALPMAISSAAPRPSVSSIAGCASKVEL